MARTDDVDPEGTRLPVRFDGTSNGEFMPVPDTPRQRKIRQLALADATDNARRLGIGRRAFLVGAAGSATVLAACNRAHPDAGGRYALAADSALDDAAARSTLAGDEFIFDVQLHCVDPTASWANGPDGEIWRRALERAFPQAAKCGTGGYDCYSAQSMAKEVFLESDTDAGVVSALWGTAKSNPTPIAYAAEARAVGADTAGTFDPRGPKESVARERSRWAEEGDSGIQSCSSVGPGGWTGCALKQWRKERQQEGYYQ